jgi:hypothetical protein
VAAQIPLALDSAMRAFIRQHYFREEDPHDKEIRGVYDN